MLITSAKLRQRIKVQRREDVRDAFGGVANSWVDVATLWAEVLDRSGKQIYNTDQQLNEVYTRIRIRFRRDVHPEMRVVFGGKNYDISSVLDLTGDGSFIELMCLRGASDG